MNIRKRTGEVVPFQEEKILNAMKKAFSGQAQEIDDRALDEMLSVVLKRLAENGGLTVERVQDEVERVLMECGHYEVAKAYILYREKRAALRRVRADLAREVGDDALEDVLRQIQKDFEEEVYPLSALQLKFESFCKPAMTMDSEDGSPYQGGGGADHSGGAQMGVHRGTAFESHLFQAQCLAVDRARCERPV